MAKPVPHPFTPGDLFDLAAHDPTVRSYLDGWKLGRFVSFEDMLLCLACTLAAQKQEHRDHIRRVALNKRR